MRVPDPDVVRNVSTWARYAEDDLTYARYGLAMGDRCPFRLVAYHAQQCAEKYLKGYLVLAGVDFPYTHDIERLLSLCASAGASVDGLLGAAELTPHAVVARYPGEADEVVRTDAERAVQLAELVKQAVRQWLADAGVNDLP